jgi:peptidoglycan/xylan/chitin deacetylase (PgdA/CDA1 family)
VPPARVALVALVVSGYATAAVAVIAGAPPLWFTIPLALAYATMINLGTYFPNLQVFLDVISHGPPGARGVALTFDDGPHPAHTRQVLDILDEYGAKATFFIIGTKAEAHPEVIRDIAARGHDLAVHGYTHDRFLNMRRERRIADDVAKTAAIIERLGGQKTVLFRPPLGFTSPRTTVVVREIAANVIGYSARAYDGLDVTNAARIVSRIAPRLEDGAIVLLHDAAERGDRRPASVDALRGILEEMKSRGLAGVGLTSWLPELERLGRLRKPRSRSTPLSLGALSPPHPGPSGQ